MSRLAAHLGTRVSDLLDGQLDREEEERAWAHVHGCHACRDLVEREGWVKTRLAGLSMPVSAPAGLSTSLKGSLADLDRGLLLTPGEAFMMAMPSDPRPRRSGLAALGGGAAGAAVMGVLALGAAPAQAPTLSPRPPLASVTSPVPGTAVVHLRRLNQP